MSMRRLVIAFTTGVLTFAAMGIAATADSPAPTTFVVVLNAEEEVPHCAAATNASRGHAIFHVTDEATSTVEWKLVANNLPGTPVAAHIHLAPKGKAGMVVQPLPPSPGEENGVIGTGTFSNPVVLAGLRAHPSSYYVNVHSTVCPSGVIRGQFGDHGP
jgi:hypothetical protein